MLASEISLIGDLPILALYPASFSRQIYLCRGFLKSPAVMRKVTSAAQACQLLTVACEDLPTAREEEEDNDGPRYIAPAELSSLKDLPVPTASGAIVRFGSRRYTSCLISSSAYRSPLAG